MSTYDTQSCCVDSFSVGSGGALTEHGPYGVDAELVSEMDITADSKYAVFSAADFCTPYCDTYVIVEAINADGSLGEEYAFGGDGSLGDASGGAGIRLSPNEKFLFCR